MWSNIFNGFRNKPAVSDLTFEQYKQTILEYNGKVDDKFVIRFCTSWATKEEDVDYLIEAVKLAVQR